MAELAAAGSVVGLLSLSIQSCQGLTSYYSAWRSYDEQISQTYRNVEELKVTCENLDRGLQKISQDQEPAVQQVVRLIASCQDGIQSLHHALDRCHSTQVPHSLAAKIELYRARALYPFRKQTLQTLKDTVQSIQGNLGSALQILQLHLSTGHEQRLASLARTASSTETTVANNQTAIQALISPLQALSQAFPLIQQRTENTAIAVRAVHDETHMLRQDAQDFRQKVFQELTNLANRADSSPKSLETAIVQRLNSHSAEMNGLKRDLQLAQSQYTDGMFAKLEAIDQSIKGLQIGIIGKPSLMQSVCEENRRAKNFLASDNAQRGNSRRLRDDRERVGQRCSCKLKPRSSQFEVATKWKWKFTFETESTSHHRTCPLFPNSASTTTARFRTASCGAVLAGAVEASISITRGAGGFSISPVLRGAHVVPHDSPAFALVNPYRRSSNSQWRQIINSKSDLDRLLDVNIHEIELLFRAGKASPWDVDLEGNTLLHVASQYWLVGISIESNSSNSSVFESLVWFLKRLEDLCVPLNWANDCKQTFINEFVLNFPSHIDPCILVTSTTRLLDTGAEFAKFSTGDEFWMKLAPARFGMIRYASSADFVDALEDNELSVAILHQSDRELAVALRKWPQLIDQANGLAQTPLHLAVSWPHGVRQLLQHGACVDSVDKQGYTPLYYAIYLGFSETVGLLMKADCILEVPGGHYPTNVLWHVSQYCFYPGYEVWGVSQEAYIDVLDTTIRLLSERRRGLQSRLADLPIVARINAGVFRDDQILDKYAEYAELAEEHALKRYDRSPLRASTLLAGCQTAYHINTLTAILAEKLWENGFRDIDVPDVHGRTPLMISRCGWRLSLDTLVTEIEVCAWLIQKGAKLHRPQHSPVNYDHDWSLDPIQLPPKIRALHYVAANIGYRAGSIARMNNVEGRKQRQQNHLSQLSKDMNLLPATILSDRSRDNCLCACSSQGCLGSTMTLKAFGLEMSPKHGGSRYWFELATENLIHLLGPHKSCCDWLVKEIIRFRTFQELELRHTCCRWSRSRPVVELEYEEKAEIRDEDHETIELLESLLQEFEENRGNQDLLFFLKGYWATRMDQVLQEQEGRVNREGLREIGVVLHPDRT